MLPFTRFIIKKTKAMSQQREIQKRHDTAFSTALEKSGKYKRVTGKKPEELAPGEFAVYEPGEQAIRNSDIKSDFFINRGGKLINIDTKGKKESSKKSGESGVHQNDYPVSSTKKFHFSVSRALGRIATAWVTPREMAQTGEEKGMGARSSSGRSRLFPGQGRIRQVIQNIARRAIPEVLGQLGSHLTISGSRSGIAAVAHHSKDHEMRPHIEGLLGDIGLSLTHEPTDISTAGSPVYLPAEPGKRGDRALIRTSVPITDTNRKAFKANAGFLYPETN